MAKIIAQITASLPRLMEAGEYRKLRYAGGKPSLQQLKKWIEEGEVLGEVKGGMPTMRNLVERFEAEWLKERGYAARTLVEIQFKLERYRQDLGDQLIGQLDVLTVAEYLDGFSNNAYTKHRGLLIQIFAFAVAKGLAERNVAELTLIKK